MTKVNPKGSDSGTGQDEGRGSACTPKWIADLVGVVNLDPCSNSRSHINALLVCTGSGPPEDDGLLVASEVPPDWTVFLNPGYGRGVVIKWVRAYGHTDFRFLLRWDPSTDWFAALIQLTKFVWFPFERIEFEPPPGVDFSSNPFPHAIFFATEPGPEFRATGLVLKVDSIGIPAT